MPRRIAGGDETRCFTGIRPTTGFNDAPANCRGRRGAKRRCRITDRPASTMPRRIAGGDLEGDTDRGLVGLTLQRCPGELPGETRTGYSKRAPRTPGFNDAPANCRGRPVDYCRARKLDPMLQRCPGELPGETRMPVVRNGKRQEASTMPRRIAGGDLIRPVDEPARILASTMPRRIAGGDHGKSLQLRGRLQASTMPRRIAGGDLRGLERRIDGIRRLQRCPGELPGETQPERTRSRRPMRRFNDAPANCRGRRRRRRRWCRDTPCFNDAPANCRGRPRHAGLAGQ